MLKLPEMGLAIQLDALAHVKSGSVRRCVDLFHRRAFWFRNVFICKCHAQSCMRFDDVRVYMLGR